MEPGWGRCLPDPRDAEAGMLTDQGGSWTHRIQVQGPLPLPTRPCFIPGRGRSTGPSPCTGLLLGPGHGLSCPSGLSCHLLGTEGAEKGARDRGARPCRPSGERGKRLHGAASCWLKGPELASDTEQPPAVTSTAPAHPLRAGSSRPSPVGPRLTRGPRNHPRRRTESKGVPIQDASGSTERWAPTSSMPGSRRCPEMAWALPSGSPQEVGRDVGEKGLL